MKCSLCAPQKFATMEDIFTEGTALLYRVVAESTVKSDWPEEEELKKLSEKVMTIKAHVFDELLSVFCSDCLCPKINLGQGGIYE